MLFSVLLKRLWRAPKVLNGALTELKNSDGKTAKMLTETNKIRTLFE